MSGRQDRRPAVDPEDVLKVRDHLYEAADVADDAMLRGLAQDLRDRADRLCRLQVEGMT